MSEDMLYRECIYTCAGCPCRNGHFTSEEELDQSWIETEQSRRPNMARIKDWLLAYPDDLLKFAERFPPGCLVESVPPFRCPRPGTLGIVAGYQYCTDSNRIGLMILQHPFKSRARIKCTSRIVRPKGYCWGITPEVVRNIRKGN